MLRQKMQEIAGRTICEGAREADVIALVRAILYLDTQLNVMANLFDDVDGIRDHKNAVQKSAADFFAGKEQTK